MGFPFDVHEERKKNEKKAEKNVARYTLSAFRASRRVSRFFAASPFGENAMPACLGASAQTHLRALDNLS